MSEPGQSPRVVRRKLTLRLDAEKATALRAVARRDGRSVQGELEYLIDLLIGGVLWTPGTVSPGVRTGGAGGRQGED